MEFDESMKNQFSLRPATGQDFPAIKSLIHRSRINPAQLDWRRFVVAVDGSGQVIGCGQLKPHGKDIIELASIAVERSFRNQGIARVIIEHLIAQAPRPVYLTCRSGLKPFYEKWGFRVVEKRDLPPYYLRLVRLVSALSRLTARGEIMLVMKLL